ncbi:DUF106 domain-containing protein [Candidatus Woesearchaeota archaeon]|nr:DUF106 domain-containing protein [Candidatus Woesearchaeota archaeon]
MLDKILSFLGPLPTITIISLLVSIIVTLVYKYATDQNRLSAIKKESEQLRRDLKNAKDTGAMAEINKQLIEKTMEQFRASMKPMLITMIPALIILGWMQSSVAYEQLIPGKEFTTTAEFEKSSGGEIELIAPENIQLLSEPKQKANESVKWRLKGPEGNYELEYRYDNEVYTRNIKITEKWEYEDTLLEKEKSFLGIKSGDQYPIRKDSNIKAIRIDNPPVRPLGGIKILGWQPGWLATYIILSLAFSMGIRSVLKVH